MITSRPSIGALMMFMCLLSCSGPASHSGFSALHRRVCDHIGEQTRVATSCGPGGPHGRRVADEDRSHRAAHASLASLARRLPEGTSRHHILGLLGAFGGSQSTSSLREAVGHMRRALRQGSSANLLLDYSAILLELGQRADHAFHLDEALGLVLRHSSDSSSFQEHFTTLESLLLSSQEAVPMKESAEELQASVFDLLLEWTTRSSEKLRDEVSRQARAFSARTGDDWLEAAVEQITQDPSRNADDRRRLVGELLALRNSSGYSRCGAVLRRTSKEAQQLQLLIADQAILDEAICMYLDRRLEPAFLLLSQLEERLPALRYPAMHARIEWIKGLVDMQRGRFHQAAVQFEASSQLMADAGMQGNALYLRSLAAKAYDLAGYRDEAWEHRRYALSSIGWIKAAERRFTVLEEAAESMLHKEKWLEAHFFLRQMVEEALLARADDPSAGDLLVSAQLDLSYLFAQMGDSLRAEELVEKAQRTLQSLPEGAINRKRFAIEIQAVLELSTTHSIRDAPWFQAALEYFRSDSSNWRDAIEIARLQRRWAEVLMERNLRSEALEVLTRAATDLLEARERDEQLGSEAWRTRSQSLFFELTELHLLEGDCLEAAAAIESWSSGKPLDLARRVVQDALVASDSEYLFLIESTDSIVRIHIQAGEIQGAVSMLSPLPLSVRLREIRRAAEAHDPVALSEHSTALGQVLVPQRAYESTSTPLRIVSGGVTGLVPYMALFHKDRPLGELRPIIVQSSARSTPWKLGSGRAVSFEPEHSLAAFPELPILGRSSSPSLLVTGELPFERETGPSVTRARMQAAARDASILVFQTHSVATADGDPGLVVSGPTREESVLSTTEIANIAEEYSLTILAACRSAVATGPDSQAALGIAPSLSRRGVFTIGALWDLDDSATRQLVLLLIAELRAGHGPAQALHLAANELRKMSPDQWTIDYWAGLQFFDARPPARMP